MTGTERAALRLALGVLRRTRGIAGAPWAVNEATGVLWTGAGVLALGRLASRSLTLCYTGARDSRTTTSDRLVRARLALYLRAVLRAEAGDCGPVRCERCAGIGDGTHGRGDLCGWCWQQCREPIGRYGWRRIRPLWERARAHEGRA